MELHELPPKLNTVDEALRALHPDHKAEPRADIDPEALLKAQLAPTKLEMIDRLKSSISQVHSPLYLSYIYNINYNLIAGEGE